MGTPIEEIEYRGDCLVCPILFPPGKTPKFIYIVFEGIQKCPGTTKEAPNDRVFKLEPNPLNNCSWYNPTHPDYYITVTYDPEFTLVTGTDLEGPTDFFYILGFNPVCITEEILNEITCDFWDYFGGKARVFWEPDALPYTLAVTYGLCQMPGGVSDRVPAAGGGQCIKLANPVDRTNILVKVSP